MDRFRLAIGVLALVVLLGLAVWLAIARRRR
jgi:hypothetical protein